MHRIKVLTKNLLFDFEKSCTGYETSGVTTRVTIGAVQGTVLAVGRYQLAYVAMQCLTVAATIANWLRYAYKLPMIRKYILALLTAGVVLYDLLIILGIVLALLAFQLHLIVGGEMVEWSSLTASSRSVMIEFVSGAERFSELTKMLFGCFDPKNGMFR